MMAVALQALQQELEAARALSAGALQQLASLAVRAQRVPFMMPE
jgi:hypothetical protein